MSAVAVNGEAIWVRRGGSGHPVIFVHALGLDGDVWDPQIASLGSDVLWITVDLRGHGRSTANGELSVSEMAVDVIGVANALNLSRFAIVGCSLGGLVAQTVAVIEPDRVSGLLLSNTFARMDPAQANARIESRKSQAAAGEVTPESRALVLLETAPPESREVFLRSARRASTAHMLDVQEFVYRTDLSRRLRRVKCVTTVVAGAQDTRIPEPMTTDLHQLVAGSQLRILAQAGHLAHLDAPNDFNQLLGEFLDFLGPAEISV